MAKLISKIQHTLSEVELKQSSSSPVQPIEMRIGSDHRVKRSTTEPLTSLLYFSSSEAILRMVSLSEAASASPAYERARG